MENEAYKLLCLIESYAIHPGQVVGKFVKTVGEKNGFSVAFDAQQLLENLSYTANDGMELLSDVLCKSIEVHEATVGAACRVNFIVFVVLHAYHTLAKEVTIAQRIDKEESRRVFENLEWKAETPFSVLEKKNKEECNTRCCWHIVDHFIRDLRAKGHSADPTDVLTEIVSSTFSADPNIDSTSNISSCLSPDVLHEYLRRTFSYDLLSWGYEAGRLAVHSFMYIRSYLLAAARDMDADRTTRGGLTSLHATADRLLHKISAEGSDWLTTGKTEGYVVHGIAFVATVRMKKNFGDLLGTCVCSPMHRFDTFVQSGECPIDQLFFFSHFPEGATEENNAAFCHLALVVRSVEKGLLVIAVRDHVCEETLRCIEFWGSDTRTVITVTALGQVTMRHLALAFRVLPRSLRTKTLTCAQGSLCVKPIFCSNSLIHRRRAEIRSFLLSLNPQTTESGIKKRAVRHSIAGVIFGGRCAADHILMERLFDRQLHHLVNLLCLPTPCNALIPGGGMAEAYAIQYMDNKVHETSLMEGNFSSNRFETRLIRAVKNAIIAYVHSVLQRSGGFTMERALEHLSVSQERFSAVNQSRNKMQLHCDGMGVSGLGSPTLSHPLYRDPLPTPPLIGVTGRMWSGNQHGKSTLLLADVEEWEAEVEVISAYFTIATCLDHLCFTSITGNRTVVDDSNEDNIQMNEVFFYPDIV